MVLMLVYTRISEEERGGDIPWVRVRGLVVKPRAPVIAV